MDIKIKNLLSLAAKSGNVVSGEDTCIHYLKRGSIYLIIIAEDASINTVKKFEDKASYRNIPVRFWNKKDLLGGIIGKGPRSVIGIVDRGFSQNMVKFFDGLL